MYQWSDIIVENRRRLSFLGNALKIKDTNIQEFIKEKYTDYVGYEERWYPRTKRQAI